MKNKRKVHGVAATFYVRDVAQDWRQAVRQGTGAVMVFSPYITSRTAETVLGQGRSCEVHTLFQAELFASGASSTRTLLALLDAGHRLFAVPDLHAKIVIGGDRFVSVGSQNLTAAGTKRNELTVAFDSAAVSAAVRDIVAPWVATRTSITREMIVEMASMLTPATKMFAQAQRQAAIVQEGFDQRMDELAERAKIEAQRRRRILVERVNALSNALRHRRASAENVHATVRVVASMGAPTSLIVTSHNDLTRWRIESDVRELEAAYRYLCINEGTGQIGWARVMTTRITYISRSVIADDVIDAGGMKFKLTLSATQGRQAQESNLAVLIDCGGRRVAKVRLWFSSDAIQLLGIDRSNTAKEFSVLEEWIVRHPKIFERYVVRGACEPFRYEHGHLNGREAANFFGSVGTRHALRLVDINDLPVLVSRPID